MNKLKVALALLNQVIASGVDFADAHENVVLAMSLTDNQAEQLITMYDNQ